MKKYLSVLCFLTIVCTLCAQNNVITYTASEKLVDTTGLAVPGLHINDFNVPIISHTFSDGVGIITFSGNVTYLFSYVFYGCSSLISITLPNTVTNICSGAFSGCSNLSSINIPSSVKEIGQSAFYHCSSLTTITIPSSVTKLESDVFDGCSSLISVTLPNSIENIDFAAFRNCNSLTSFTIPNSVLKIGGEAFRGCTGLTSVTIPSSVTSIGDLAFAYCNGLTSITCKANTPPALGSNVFQDVPRDIPLYVPASSIPLYQAAEQWNEFDIRPLLVEIDSIAPDTVNLAWLPIQSANQYQLRIYSDQIALDTTLIIYADPYNGGIMLQGTTAPMRRPRIVLDEISSTVVISIDPNSGASPDQPFVVTVSTTSENKVDIHYDMQVLGATGDTLRQENGMFTLNEDAPLYEALGDVHSSPLVSDSFCYDLYGHRYPLSVWPSLPAGIYILHEGGVTTKIMKH